jgi:hypothetical protein
MRIALTKQEERANQLVTLRVTRTGAAKEIR